MDNAWLDRRPVERALFLGDRYTCHSDMSSMVAPMAGSAGSPARDEITMQAGGGATLEEHSLRSQGRSARPSAPAPA